MKKPLQDTSPAYIIDLYQKFSSNKNVLYVFKLHGQEYCIRQIDKFDWGQPVFPEKPIDDDFTYYHIYNSLDEARAYIRYLKDLEA